MYAASESNPGVRFFEYPLQAIEEQLDEMNEQNECCFIGLALIVLNNNKLYKHLLQNRNDKKFEDVFNDVFEDLGLINRPSKRSVLSGLQALAGNYTKELESTITVIHNKTFDIFSLYFGKRIPKTILTHGSGTFIAERFLFKSVKEDCDDLKIVIPSELEDSYFNRMVEEIENNRFYNVFKNVQVCNELYQRKFISFLSKHQSIIQKLLYNRWPLYLSAVKGCKLLVKFILSEKRTSGMCNKLDKDGNHQDMLMDKPESDMYACSYDSDSSPQSESGSECDFDDVNDNGRTSEKDACRIQFENSPMVAACEGGYIDIVECLVEYDYNIYHSDTNLPTPLLSACSYGNKNIVDFLLKKKCKVDTINEFGQIALHAACKNGHIDIVNSLLKCNSSVNLCDTDGYTPLHRACHNSHIDIVNILLKCNSSVNLCNTDGSTPLHLACINGNIDIVNILLKCNSSVNLCGTHGFTPLHLACYNGNIDIVNSLLKCNSSVNLCGIKGSTPLHIACIYGHVDIVNILLKYNSVNLCSTDGFTPLHVACILDHIDIVNILLKYNSSVNL
jgi:ankyrin repeat protein